MGGQEFVEWAVRQHQFVDETFEDAHHPLPRDMGDATIKLHPLDHAIQGIFQSEDVGRKCFWVPDTLKALNAPNYFPLGWFDAWDLFDKWKKTGGWMDRTTEDRQEVARKQGLKNAESGHLTRISRLYSHNEKQKQHMKKLTRHNVESGHVGRIGKIAANMKWECLVTGKICNAGGLTRYQQHRGIDTSLRRRID